MPEATYSGDPGTSPKDELRFELSDTDLEHALFSDEELTFLLNRSGSYVPEAALKACEILATRYAREADISVGELAVKFNKLSRLWAERAEAFRRKIAGARAKPAITTSRAPMFKVDQWTFNGDRGLERKAG
ncbi:MAG: hypothetical protein ABC596_05730 [Candidatus Methanosuratincola petrocarbonis]